MSASIIKETESSYYDKSEIKSYDIHTYWNESDKEEKQSAIDLKNLLIKTFAKEIKDGDIIVKNHYEHPIGPHPICMWEADFVKLEFLSKLIPFYQLNHGKLSVLIHPITGKGDFIDHTEHALWLGHKQRVIGSVLKGH